MAQRQTAGGSQSSHDTWDQRFEWDGPFLRGKTLVGRVSIDVPRINLQERREDRRRLN